jgi:glutamate N-acetyltransferase/amino-acid N-acetyltransferase
MSNLKYISGGVTAAKGFLAGGIHCGIRRNHSKKDLALIFSQTECDAAAVYTLNKVKGSPIIVTGQHLLNGKARAVICNSGNANTCNADGEQKAKLMCDYVAEKLDISADDVIVASTGVIGQVLPIEPIRDGVQELVNALSDNGSGGAEQAIMTTDTREKEIAVEFEIGGTVCKMGGIAKGSGMIHPNMATMLGFLTTDVSINQSLLHEALLASTQKTFNMVSVDGDTSTNDMVSIMASGLAGNNRINAKGADFDTFCEALNAVNTFLSREIARDGEGATKLLECHVTQAADTQVARLVAKSVITSSLLKAAMFGADANWGRVLCAVGYADCELDVNKVDVSFESVGGIIAVCKNGAGIEFSEDLASKILAADEIKINVYLNSGYSEATAWGCDLTYDYVKINGDYRT